MDIRCEKFSQTASNLSAAKTHYTSPKLQKEITTLRKFLLKNQEQRLTDKSQERLFDAVRTHASYLKSIGDPDAISDGCELVKDALAMPFTIFSTRHKKVLLKVLHELTALAGEAEEDDVPNRVLQVVDLDDEEGYLTLLETDSGEMVEGICVEKGSDSWERIRGAIESDDVYVTVNSKDYIVAVSVGSKPK